jgi:hypothetical protein
MKRSTQNILYHTLPIVFWLLAGLVCALPWFFQHSTLNSQLSITDYLPARLALISVMIVHHIPRHGSAIEPCFRIALLLGIAAYWLPSVVFLVLPIWVYLIYRNLFNLRVFTATLISLVTVAIWMVVFHYLSIFTFPFPLTKNLWNWLPTGSLLFAYIASTISRQNLRVR